LITSTKLAKTKMGKKKKSHSRDKLKEKLHKIAGYIMAIIALLLVAVVFGGAYYFVIAPNLISKPLIEKPSLPEDGLTRIQEGEQVIGSDHINYLINEIGAYKLKKPFGTKNYPIMEFVLTDVNKVYYGYVNDHKPTTKKGNAKNQDIVIRGTQETIFNILNSNNTLIAVKEAKDNGEIDVELTADMKILAAKGYLSIYDTLR